MLRKSICQLHESVSTVFIRNYAKISSKLYYSTEMAQKPEISTVDKSEISHFATITDWWDENGRMKPLHAMNSLRVPFLRDGLINTGIVSKELMNTPKPLQGLQILDVGCGGGILTEALARLGAHVTGLDACKELIDCAQLHVKDTNIENNITYVYDSIEDHNSGSNCNKYDGVIASEIVEHVNSPRLFLESCCGVLKPGGSIFVTTVNKTWLAWFGVIIAAENILNIVPKGTHVYEKFIAPHEVQKILEDYNCRTKCVHGMFYNFLWNQWYWFPDQSVNFALHAVKAK